MCITIPCGKVEARLAKWVDERGEMARINKNSKVRVKGGALNCVVVAYRRVGRCP